MYQLRVVVRHSNKPHHSEPTAGGVLPNGTENVMISCNCLVDHGTVFTGVKWWYPNGKRIPKFGTNIYVAGTPHYTRPSGDTNNRNNTL